MNPADQPWYPTWYTGCRCAVCGRPLDSQHLRVENWHLPHHRVSDDRRRLPNLGPWLISRRTG